MQSETELAKQTELPKGCNCVARMNEALRETYPGVRLLTSISGQRPVIEVYRTAKRVQKPTIFPTFCPFCGIKYGA